MNLVSRSEAAHGHSAIPAHAVTAWRRRQAWLTLGALGVVYGDIGTSPLYAVRQSVLATVSGGLPMREAVVGAISLILWSLIIIVTIKYVVFILRADNKGEGGVIALASLAHRTPGLSRRMKRSSVLQASLDSRCSSATGC
jgi:KUP system potassium uptake protein